MKKFTLFFLILTSILFSVPVFAGPEDCPGKWDQEFGCPGDFDRAVEAQKEKQKESSNSGSGQSEIIVKVSEKVPGANCGEKDASTGLYECKIKPGFKSVQSIMGNIIKWATAIAALSGVLFIVVNGIMLSTGSESGEVKKRIIAGIIGLILVLLSGVILNIIAPWVYK